MKNEQDTAEKPGSAYLVRRSRFHSFFFNNFLSLINNLISIRFYYNNTVDIILKTFYFEVEFRDLRPLSDHVQFSHELPMRSSSPTQKLDIFICLTYTSQSMVRLSHPIVTLYIIQYYTVNLQLNK